MCEDLSDMAISESVQEIRRFADTPIMVVVRSGGEMDVVNFLEMGADDYVAVPGNMMVLVARAVAVLRRVGLTRSDPASSSIQCGELTIDPSNEKAYVGQRPAALTHLELTTASAKTQFLQRRRA